MNKKWITLVLLGPLFLGACGNVMGEATEEADVEESEMDTQTVLKTSSTGEQTQENGPFKVTLKDAEITQIPPEETLARDLVKLSVLIEVTNESEELNTIHPNQTVIITDTGQEVIADRVSSDKVGGDFSENEIKQGEIIFIFSGKIDDVSTIHFLIDTGYDSEYNWLGENLEFVFEF